MFSPQKHFGQKGIKGRLTTTRKRRKTSKEESAKIMAVINVKSNYHYQKNIYCHITTYRLNVA